ncbi:DUF664 domain-containing protein [Deinococcus frigens]|uniref:mycothiol transferase n=1 Tax=Deinococcus frigens TaxID=249403 RepID=UPI000496EE5D|nr:DUF664 domain-containing protein [Deinococcus frigens]
MPPLKPPLKSAGNSFFVRSHKICQAASPYFTEMNHHWAWFHVMEDEVSHRGQIRILRKRIAPRKKE